MVCRLSTGTEEMTLCLLAQSPELQNGDAQKQSKHRTCCDIAFRNYKSVILYLELQQAYLPVKGVLFGTTGFAIHSLLCISIPGGQSKD